MPSPHLERKLKEALGDDAGAELAAVTDRIDPIRGDIAELRHGVRNDIAELRHGVRNDIAEVRNGVRNDIAELRHGVHNDIAEVRGELGAFRHEMHAMRDALMSHTDKGLLRIKSELIAWSFVFWVGAVAAIAVLAGVVK